MGTLSTGGSTASEAVKTSFRDAIRAQKYVGIHTDLATAEAAFPSASNAGAFGMMGSAAPYTPIICDGVQWFVPYQLAGAISYVQMTASGIAKSGACQYAGYECITAGGGNITIYHNTAASGDLLLASTALSVGKFERNFKIDLSIGVYVVLTGTPTVNILVK